MWLFWLITDYLLEVILGQPLLMLLFKSNAGCMCFMCVVHHVWPCFPVCSGWTCCHHSSVCLRWLPNANTLSTNACVQAHTNVFKWNMFHVFWVFTKDILLNWQNKDPFRLLHCMWHTISVIEAERLRIYRSCTQAQRFMKNHVSNRERSPVYFIIWLANELWMRPCCFADLHLH